MMLKKYQILKWSLISLTSFILIFLVFGIWFMSLLPSDEHNENLKNSIAENLTYLSDDVVPYRGKILAVVTNVKTMGESTKKTGYELTELSRAYYVFKANGFEVDVASPLGGKPRVVIDGDDMAEFDYAFLNDSIAQHKVNHTIAIDAVIPENYEAIYFVGGKGAMYDFPNNKTIQSIVREYYQLGKVIGAVCHGPAALVNVALDNGDMLIENKRISSFTDKEELLLIPEAKTIFPFLLQSKLIAQGAQFFEGAMYLENVCRNGTIVTGQNPWSTWKLAETMIQQLGYDPKVRQITSEENAITVLKFYRKSRTKKTEQFIDTMVSQGHIIDRRVIAMHCIVAGIEGDISSFIDLVNLVHYVKRSMN